MTTDDRERDTTTETTEERDTTTTTPETEAHTMGTTTTPGTTTDTTDEVTSHTMGTTTETTVQAQIVTIYPTVYDGLVITPPINAITTRRRARCTGCREILRADIREALTGRLKHRGSRTLGRRAAFRSRLSSTSGTSEIDPPWDIFE